ncbi:uncharacterized protein LOC142981123 [Anticarsia gemmatalis]|uniref:uncharacterized protein LOC142981123 n=1 Tax=Anticarsia gemmatalis TaxID=129554 RepID=UPI003F766732
MHSLLFLMLLTGSCLAHYRSSYDSRNFIVREEPTMEDDGETIVECPVCDYSDDSMVNKERCLKIGNKSYKKCKFGTYINEVCGGKRDCYRGPGDECTEKMTFDTYGRKCAPGYYCNKSVGRCTGFEYTVDSGMLIGLTHFPYNVRRSQLKGISDDAKFAFEGTRN